MTPELKELIENSSNPLNEVQGMTFATYEELLEAIFFAIDEHRWREMWEKPFHKPELLGGDQWEEEPSSSASASTKDSIATRRKH